MRNVVSTLATVLLLPCWISTAAAAPVPKDGPQRVEVLSCSDCLQRSLARVAEWCSRYYQPGDTRYPCRFLNSDAEMANIANFHLGYLNSADFDERQGAADLLLKSCSGSEFPFLFERYLKEIAFHLERLEDVGSCNCPELRYQTKSVADKCFDEDAWMK